MQNFWQKLNNPILALAPMAGITDSAFRLICKKQGADVVYSEMISADALHYKSKKTLDMLKFAKSEQPLVIQLFGKRPEMFIKAIKHVEAVGASGIDINFGCPAKKVVAHGGGVILMKNLDLCYEIIKTVCDNTKLPVSVKIRTSINSGSKKITAIDFLQKITDLPVSCVMIHGRSYEQAFSGEVNFKMIKEARKYFKGIILANGGIIEPDDGANLLKKSKADGIGLARGIYGRPWLFKEIKAISNDKPINLSWSQKKKIILEHAKYANKFNGDHGIIELRKHLLWYVKGLPEAKSLRTELVRVKTIEDIKQILENIKYKGVLNCYPE